MVTKQESVIHVNVSMCFRLRTFRLIFVNQHQFHVSMCDWDASILPYASMYCENSTIESHCSLMSFSVSLCESS